MTKQNEKGGTSGGPGEDGPTSSDEELGRIDYNDEMGIRAECQMRHTRSGRGDLPAQVHMKRNSLNGVREAKSPAWGDVFKSDAALYANVRNNRCSQLAETKLTSELLVQMRGQNVKKG